MNKLTSQLGNTGVWVVAILAAIVVTMAVRKDWLGINKLIGT